MSAADRRGAYISRGLRYMVASAFFFSVMSLLVKMAGRRIPSQEIVLARAIVTLVLSWIMVRRAGVSPWGNRRGLLILRGLLGFTALSCFFFAITRLPLAEVTVLQYMNPLFTALLAAAFIGERLNPVVLVSIAVCLAGVTLITQPGFLFDGAAAVDPLGAGVALAAAFFSGAAYVTVRKASATEHPLVIVFWFSMVAVPGSIPLAAADFVMPGGVEWLMLIGVGVVTQIAQVFLTRGLGLEPAGRAMAVAYTQILFAAAWGALFFAEIPGPLSAVGSLLVMGGTLAIVLRGPAAVGGR